MTALSAKTIMMGNPPSSAHQPSPVDLADWMQVQESLVAGGGLSYMDGSVAELEARAGTADAEYGLVLSAADEAGVYEKGGGVWEKRAGIPAIFVESLAAIQALAAKDEAVASAALSSASALLAVSAADAAGVVSFYDTKAAADAALAGLSEDDVVEVLADESQGSARTRYRVEGGLLVFKVNLSTLRPEQNLSDVADPVAARQALGVELSAAGEMTVPYYLRVGFGDDATAGAWDAAYAFNVKGKGRIKTQFDIQSEDNVLDPTLRLETTDGYYRSQIYHDLSADVFKIKVRDADNLNTQAYLFYPAGVATGDTAVLRKVDADALYAPLLQAQRVWEDVEDMYDFAVEGAIASIDSLDLDDGYEHRFFFDGLEIAAADQIDFEVYRETDGVWQNAGRVVGSVATADFVFGHVVFSDARAVDNYHSVDLFADDETSGLTGSGSKTITIATKELVRFGTAQPIQKVRFFTPAVVNFTGGKIIHQRRPL